MIKNIHRHTSVPCKNMKELKRLLWWAKKSGYRWSNGQSYNDNYMINFLEERFDFPDGETITLRVNHGRRIRRVFMGDKDVRVRA